MRFREYAQLDKAKVQEPLGRNVSNIFMKKTVKEDPKVLEAKYIKTAKKQKHPGSIENWDLLKIDTYIKSKSNNKANYIVREDIKMKDLKWVPSECWDMLRKNFGFDYEICRPWNPVQKLFNPHMRYINVMVMNPWTHKQSNILQKIYYDGEETFDSLKKRIADWINVVQQ
jgi:hypothetical protein